MIKYQLSKYINIIQPADYLETSTPPENLMGYFILINMLEEKRYLINETVKYFIDKFLNPKTQAEVLKEVAQEVQTREENIKKTCSNFFDFLSRRKIVVPEGCLELKQEIQTLFKEGDLINNLRILEIIGNKKYLDIYLTLEELTGATYVVKLLNAKKISDKVKYAYEFMCIKHEYKMLQKIIHIPSLCQAYSFHKKGNQMAYIILEHIKGKTLHRFLRQTESLTAEDCFTIIQNILTSFSSLHESSLLHGDIHPSNIMVDEDKSVKIIDLGLSIDVTVENDELLKSGGIFHYMPPERINTSNLQKFSKGPDFFSEVYQLGVIMYFIIYRDVPFTGFTWKELSENIKKKEITYPALSHYSFPVPKQIIKIIQQCLQKKPSKRYATATFLLKDFKKVILETEVLIP